MVLKLLRFCGTVIKGIYTPFFIENTYLDAEKVLLDRVMYRKVVFCTQTKYCASEQVFKENMHKVVTIILTHLF